MQAAQVELQRQQATDSLRKGLEHRPEREELIQRKTWNRPDVVHSLILAGNILPDSHAAPSLQRKQQELDRAMRADALEQRLQRRPTAEELIKEGIMEPGDVQRS